jgi:hypothetical protein
MLGMSGPETAWILTILIVIGSLTIIGIVQEIGKTRRAKHEADKARYEAAAKRMP